MSEFIQLLPTKSYSGREYHYDQFGGYDLADGVLTLIVKKGRKEVKNAYALQCERTEAGHLAVVYLAKARSENGEVYGIELHRNGIDSRCSCTGHARHKACKHDSAIRDLIANGQLEGGRVANRIRLSRAAQAEIQHAKAMRAEARRTVLALLGYDL